MPRRRPRLLPLVVLATHVGVGCASVEQAAKSPNADALCPDPRGEQRVPYRSATICVSNHFAELLECLETNQLEEVATDAKERVSGSAEGGNASGPAALGAEASAVGGVETKYGSGPLAGGVEGCIAEYEWHDATASKPRRRSFPIPTPAPAAPTTDPGSARRTSPALECFHACLDTCPRSPIAAEQCMSSCADRCGDGIQ